MSSKKRSLSHFDNGKRKRHSFKRDEIEKSSKAIDTMYRILCPIKKIGSVLGKGGSIINELRGETHAKIRVADAIPGADERVIIIYSYLSEEPGKYDSDQDIEKFDLADTESEQMKPHCPAQDALLKVHDRIAADELLHGSKDHSDGEDDEAVTTRILVPNNQVGCLLGKGGNIIQRLRGDTGANIRILPAEHLPPCAMSTDELVQISGIPSVARRALYEISTLLYQHPRKENPPLDDVIYASTQGSYPPPGASVPPAPPMPWYGGYGDESSRFFSGTGGHIGRGEKSEEFSMKLVCSAMKIGGVIGKGGANVRQLQQQTGANIQVENTSDAEERVIVVSSKEVLWDPVSPTIEAILQLQSRTCEASDKGITTRLLVPSSKVGCLLGQGGHIITEMRRRTKADIRVYSKDDKPKYASSNEELVQITGNQSVARDALSEIASRLRERTLQGGNPDAENHVLPHSFHGYAPPEGFAGRGLPPSGIVGAGRTGSYEHLKGTGQKLEAGGYHMASINTGYPIYRSSPEIKIPSSETASILTKDGSHVSGINQMSGARAKLYDPFSGASEYAVDMRGSSAQWNASQNYSQSYASGRQTLASGGQNFQPSQGHYPY